MYDIYSLWILNQCIENNPIERTKNSSFISHEKNTLKDITGNKNRKYYNKKKWNQHKTDCILVLFQIENAFHPTLHSFEVVHTHHVQSLVQGVPDNMNEVIYLLSKGTHKNKLCLG